MRTVGVNPHRYGNLLRSCAGCSAHLLTSDGYSDRVYCARCRPRYLKPFDEWAAGLVVGDRVYLQPVIAGPFARSEWLIVERTGDSVTVHVLGMPDTRRDTTVAQLCQQSLARRLP